MTYDNIKSHKKAGFHLLFRTYIFRKTTGGVDRFKLNILDTLLVLDTRYLFIHSSIYLFFLIFNL